MKYLISILSIFIILSLTLCNKKQSSISEINLTYVKSPLNVPAIINYKKSMFSNDFAPIKVNYHEINSGAQQTEAMASGDIDFATVLGGTSAILSAANGNNIKIIGMFGRAPKAFRIMGKNPSITTLADLKGKKIGGPKGTVLHQLLISALKKEGLTIDDVEFISMGISDALNGMLTKTIDVALLGGPATLIAEKQGAHVITTGEGLIDGATVIAIRGELFDNNPEIIKQFLQTHYKSLEYMKQNMVETLELTAETVGLSTEEVKSMLPYYDFSPKITETDIENLIATQDFLYETKLLSQKINIKDIIIIP